MSMLKIGSLVLVAMLAFGMIAQAQVSTFPYGAYNWTGAAALTGVGGGDGNYRTSKVGGGSIPIWATSATGGTANSASATVTAFKGAGNSAHLDLVLNTTGLTFTGSESYSFQVKVGAVPVAAITTFKVQADGAVPGTFVDIASVDASTLTTTMSPFTVTLPANMQNLASVTLRISAVAVSNPTAGPAFTVDDNTVFGGALPVQVASFSHQIDNVSDVYNVTLDWMTVSETNNYGFYIERRSSTEASFSTLPNSFVAGNGTTLESNSYSWVDENVASGTFEYRLKQVDQDGLESFSTPIEVVVDKATSVKEEQAPVAFQLNQNYPNPFNPTTDISFSVAQTQTTTLKVYNILGSEVATLFSGVANAGRLYTVTFDASGLSSGMYFYRVENGNNIEVRKMSLMK